MPQEWDGLRTFCAHSEAGAPYNLCLETVKKFTPEQMFYLAEPISEESNRDKLLEKIAAC